MSLLESDDFTYYSKESNVSPNMPRFEEERTVPPPFEAKGRVRSGELTVDTQKMSSFSLRRKKDKDSEGKTHKKNKSVGKIQPPDSPKSKASPSPAIIKPSKKQQQYAHLLENEPSSDEDDAINSGAFVLSKGHQAREKRSSFKSTSGGEGLQELMVSTMNPTVADKTFGTSPVTSSVLVGVAGSGVESHFPVSFTPPTVVVPATVPGNDFMLGLSEPVAPDPIPPLPPPHSHTHKYPPVAPVIPPPQAAVLQTAPTTDELEWCVTDELYDKCVAQFKDLCPSGRLLSGERARDFFLKSNLPVNELSKIWKLSDIDGDGSLTLDEFVIALKLVLMRRRNFEIPLSLPPQLKVPPTKVPPTKPEPVPLFKFPPPPPSKSHTQHTPVTASSSVPAIEPTQISPPIPPLPAFLTTTNRSKTEPSIAISDAQTSSIEHILAIDDEPHPLEPHPLEPHPLEPHPLELSVDQQLPSQIEGGVVDLLTASFMSEGDVPLLAGDKGPSPPPLVDTSFKEPAVSRLISLSLGGEESTGDEDDTSNLVTSGEFPPVPRPRKKKQGSSDLQRARTVHGRVGHPPPPRPPPYKKSVSPPPIELEPTQSVATPSPIPDDDLAPIISSYKPSIPPKPDLSLEKTSNGEEDKGHGRSTSWDLTKVLRDVRFHDDVPSAEPPKPPPRLKKDEGGYHSDDEDDGWRLGKVTPLQRSASTGSLASTGLPSIPTKSRTSSVESGALLTETRPEEQLVHRAGTIVRRPAPAPPPNKPKKPMYPPSFKKVVVDVSRERSSSGDLEDSLQSAEVYQKKSKSELQKSIKRLKEENNMYNSLNSELNKKLNELKQERLRLEFQLKSVSS